MLRPMEPADAETVAALVRAAFAAHSVATDPPASARLLTAADVAAHLARGGGGAVVTEGDAVVASVMWSPADGGLSDSRLAVAPAWRRRGLARALLGAAEAAARAAGLPRVHLATRLVLLDNQRLFAAAGYVEVSRSAHPGYTQPTSIALEKRL